VEIWRVIVDWWWLSMVLTLQLNLVEDFESRMDCTIQNISKKHHNTDFFPFPS